MAETQKIVILDFGGQYTQLIARRVRECKVYSEVLPYHASVEQIRAIGPKGIILSGGPASVLEKDAPRCDLGIWKLGVPVLGICYGMQLTAHLLGGTVEKAAKREYGRIRVTMDDRENLLKGMSESSSNWMSHTYQVKVCPPGFHAIAHAENCPVAAMANPEKHFYGVQFHPEVTHSEEGKVLLHTFLRDICGCAGDWTMEAYAQTAVRNIREAVGETGTVLLALSGGVDSSVAAALIYKAIGDRLTCVYVDHGFMRKGESEQVAEVFSKTFPVRFIPVDASEEFYADLQDVSDPEQKRKIIGAEFIHVFEEEARKLDGIDFLGQGTIYPDIVESGTKTAKMVKSHHNVGGLPEDLQFELVEPLRQLFKDEVRACGVELGLPYEMVYRQPFPGPGLGVRCLGAITRDRLEAVRESDAILREEFQLAGLDKKVWQYFTVVPDFKSVGVRDNARSFDWPVIIRAVNTVDAMTATIEPVDWPILMKITDRILKEVKTVNRVCYDMSPKPNATIEWE